MAARITIMLLVLLQVASTFAQNVNPADNEIYKSGEVATIRITMDEADKQFLLADENVDSNVYLQCDFHFVNSEVNELAQNVGIRLRGNTSRYQPKRSFKIDFREFGGPKFHDLKKFNLKAENNDPSMLREHLALQVFRKANIPAARSSHVELYINEEYMGLYLNVEQIDDEFVELRFGNDNGNIYKCYWGATLEDNGTIWNDWTYELKTNEEENNRAVLENFVRVLNNSGSTTFPFEMERTINVDGLIRYFAVEALVGHWDGYSYNKNNFYLYENPENGLIEFIPYDVDNTFGIDWVNRDWAERDVLDWPKHGDPRPLVTRMLENEAFFIQYVRELRNLLETTFSVNYFQPILNNYPSVLRPSMAADVYYPLTFGFDIEDFEDAYSENFVANHLPYGIENFIERRIEMTEDQIAGITITDSDQELNEFSLFPNPLINNRFLIIGDVEPVEIIDSRGGSIGFEVQELSYGEHSVMFSTSPQPGLYMVLLNNGVARKLVVK
ncbi:MAG: CotH kinase family protein [bacterium]|nr:CotH kinase family protein [bacterium]